MKKIIPFLLLLFTAMELLAQTTIILKPNSLFGKDAYIESFNANLNYGTVSNYAAIAWTGGGNSFIARSLIEFNLSSIPSYAAVTSAKLFLYCNTTSDHTQLHSSLSGSNACFLQRITSPWNENTITWNNQPTTTILNQTILAQSTSQTQDYLNIDIFQLIIDTKANPSTSFGLMIKLQTEILYRSLIFASSDHPDSTKWPMLVITYTIDSCSSFKNVASFSSSDTNGVAPLTVQFNNTSLATATSFVWDFGDSSAISSVKNPSHTYLKAGKHLAKLFAHNNQGCVDSTKIVIDVADSCGDFIHAASFTSSVLNGVAPLSVQFTNNSLPTALSFIWDFGDASPSSSLKNPAHIFYNGKKTYVKLLAFNSKGCKDSSEITIDVIDSCADIIGAASFSSNTTSGPEPLTVQFNNTSLASARTFFWDFGDSTAISTLQNPSHLFLKKGSYLTKLTVLNNRGCADSVETIITVLDSCALFKHVTSFAANPSIGYVALNVQFVNNSAASAISFNWNFGDSTQISTLQNPSHLFLKEGIYVVKLFAYNQRGCADSFETSVRVAGNINLLIPNIFTPNNDDMNDEFVISYTPFSLNSIKGSIWNRWGSKVYEFGMPDGKWWDGFTNGVEASDGIYFYIIETNDLLDNTKTYCGTLMLLR